MTDPMERLQTYFAASEYRRGFDAEPERWSYFEGPGQTLFCYNTTPIVHLQGELDSTTLEGEVVESVPEQGAWTSWVMDPYGPGSRSGKAKKWRERPDSRSRHERRKDAKARALRLLNEAKAASS